jgi:tRNA(Ile2) C34 agmatinyltransferase TiaS
MKPCSLCRTNEKSKGMTRCKPCNADYMREYMRKRRSHTVGKGLSSLLARGW